MQKKQASTGLIWFTNNLRIIDNKSIEIACKKHDRIIAVYVFDKSVFEKKQFGFKKIEIYRAQFLIETVTALKESLAQENISLLTYFELPEIVIPKICKAYHITEIFAQKEWTPEETGPFNMVEINSNSNCTFTYSYDQFLYHPVDIPMTFESIPSVFTHFRKKVEKECSIRPEGSFDKRKETNLIDHKTTIPQLATLGYGALKKDTRSAFPYHGGEKEALKRIDFYFFESKKLSFYKQTRNGLIGTDYSSKLSPWLANGCISAKTIYWKVKEYEAEFGANESTYWLIFELVWRDYFKYISLKHGNSFFKIDGILQKKYAWKSNELQVQKWIDGRTEEPFVNANMIELKETGFMSNRGRQNVASFFAKELLLDWRIGAAYFESMLIDYDVHSNYGNWSYISGVGNDPRDRKFNVKKQAKNYDPDNRYQDNWLQNQLL
jgi:deoxyribodipyrimidine photo-lyase